MSGQWGSTILEFVITFAVVLVLVAVVYWLVRRYSGHGLGRIGRGRVPRLAVIDAMAVDGRRRLILVRRDNVEHLILVGGPSDVVIEHAILRPRQRPAARPQVAAPQASIAIADGDLPAEMPAPNPESQPIPFPQSHGGQAGGSVPPGGAFFSSRRTPQPQMDRGERAELAVSNGGLVNGSPTDNRPHLSGLPPFETLASQDSVSPFPSYGDNGNRGQPRRDIATSVVIEQPFVPPPPGDNRRSNATVNDLEREMARLLGEITVKRSP